MILDRGSFILSIEDVKDIYRAGIRRGNQESSSFEWGCIPSGKEFEELSSCLFDLANDPTMPHDYFDKIVK